MRTSVTKVSVGSSAPNDLFLTSCQHQKARSFHARTDSQLLETRSVWAARASSPDPAAREPLVLLPLRRSPTPRLRCPTPAQGVRDLSLAADSWRNLWVSEVPRAPARLAATPPLPTPARPHTTARHADTLPVRGPASATGPPNRRCTQAARDTHHPMAVRGGPDASGVAGPFHGRRMT